MLHRNQTHISRDSTDCRQEILAFEMLNRREFDDTVLNNPGNCHGDRRGGFDPETDARMSGTAVSHSCSHRLAWSLSGRK